MSEVARIREQIDRAIEAMRKQKSEDGLNGWLSLVFWSSQSSTAR